MERDYKLIPNSELIDRNLKMIMESETFSLVYDNGSDEAVSTAYYTAYVLMRDFNLRNSVLGANKNLETFSASYKSKLKDIRKRYGTSINKLIDNALKSDFQIISIVRYVLNKIKTKVDSDIVYIAWILGIYFGQNQNEAERGN